METRNIIKSLCKEKVKTFFLSHLIALNVKWVPRFSAEVDVDNLSAFVDEWQRNDQMIKWMIKNNIQPNIKWNAESEQTFYTNIAVGS